ncbi:MAG: hypothetical protein HY722_12270 [Planctomycetes bacterium]|nr:hypothetical protein [Planctomycetota bacterium]
MKRIARFLVLASLLGCPAGLAHAEDEGDAGKEDDVREWSSDDPQAEDPLAEIRKLMAQVEQRLSELLPGEETQQAQGEILRRLDEIIRQAESASSCECPECQEERRAQQQAMERERRQREKDKLSPPEREREEARRPEDPNDNRDSRNDEQRLVDRPEDEEAGAIGPGGSRPAGRRWGNLPPRLRDEVIDAQGGRFPPDRRERIQDYYRRLAEGARAAEDAAPASGGE